MNILILSCGTRYKLVDYFRKEPSVNKVVVTDCSPQSPALYVADAYYIVPRMKDPSYPDTLKEICRKEAIDYILPLQEDELILMASKREEFREAGAEVVISDYDTVVLCRDKYLLNATLEKMGIPAVKTELAREYLASGNDWGEVFVKPRNGAGSINTMPVRNLKFLEYLCQELEEELIVQPRITGKEYGVDLYVDLLSGKVMGCFVKQKLRMRAGETEKSLSVRNPEIESLVIGTAEALHFRGPIDMDVMEQDGKYYILEINPRFGGGYPHAHECGMNFPAMLARNAHGEENISKIGEYEEGVLGLKYSDIYIGK